MHASVDPSAPALPAGRADGALAAADRFIRTESVGGALLGLVTLTTLVVANLPSVAGILTTFDESAGIHVGDWSISHPLRVWINDGLLTIFFFVVGLEIKRELSGGALSQPGALWLPLLAAIGGMAVPAAIYLAILADTAAADGWGIVVATDIAFVVGCLALFGRLVPDSLRILLIAIAIFDDLGAILVIAFGYGHGFQLIAFLVAAVFFALAWLMQWGGIRAVTPFWIVGILCWIAMHESGIHPTLAGVALGLLTPAKPWVDKHRLESFLVWSRNRFAEMRGSHYDPSLQAAVRVQLARAAKESIPPLYRLEHVLHPLSAFLILPLFALANAGIPFAVETASDPLAIGIVLALVVGKPLGITLAVWLASQSGVGRLPEGISWPTFAMASCFMGIGFTMSLFIAAQAFEGPMLAVAKTGVLIASLAAALVGMALLSLSVVTPPHASSSAHKGEKSD